MIGSVIVVGLITQHIIRQRRPSSGALKLVPADETVSRVLAVVVFLGWITLLRLAPTEGRISAFLDAWYGWPVAIALGIFVIYVVTLAFTFVRLALKRRDHGA
jgi:Na+/phosphate symporter